MTSVLPVARLGRALSAHGTKWWCAYVVGVVCMGALGFYIASGGFGGTRWFRDLGGGMVVASVLIVGLAFYGAVAAFVVSLLWGCVLGPVWRWARRR